MSDDAAEAPALASEIGALVRALRTSRGLSMRALAAEAGVSQPFLSKLENGRLLPSLSTLYALAAAFDVLQRNGFQTWVVLDDWEEEPFRQRFPALAAASIDSRPIVESAPGVGVRTRAWGTRLPE